MIISKTPLRISFCGGGSDLKEYYSKKQGSVVSTSINKYITISVKQISDKNRIILRYPLKENVTCVEKIRHPIIRESIKLVGISGGIEITSKSDTPSSTGLGSSSAFTVGLLNALYAYAGKKKTAEEIAKKACEIEISILKEPIGKQDQYIAAYGGFRHILFNRDESVELEEIEIPERIKKELQDNLLLFYTGIRRKASDILKEQSKKTEKNIEILEKMTKLSLDLKTSLLKGDIAMFGELLHRNWEYKKKLAEKITNPVIEGYYNKAMEVGALGGKVLGAGGGGFLLFFVRGENQEKLRKTLKLDEVKFSFEKEGSKIINE